MVRYGGSVAWKKGHVGGVFMYKANLKSFRDLPYVADSRPSASSPVIFEVVEFWRIGFSRVKALLRYQRGGRAGLGRREYYVYRD